LRFARIVIFSLKPTRPGYLQQANAQVQQRGRTRYRLLTRPLRCKALLSPPSAATSG